MTKTEQVEKRGCGIANSKEEQIGENSIGFYFHVVEEIFSNGIQYSSPLQEVTGSR